MCVAIHAEFRSINICNAIVSCFELSGRVRNISDGTLARDRVVFAAEINSNKRISQLRNKVSQISPICSAMEMNRREKKQKGWNHDCSCCSYIVTTPSCFGRRFAMGPNN